MYDVSPVQLLIIAAAGLITSVIGGVAGYGTGALMPLVLVPIVGAEPVVPIIALSAIFNNVSRATLFRDLVDWRRVRLVILPALPTCALGAWGYTLLDGRGALVVIGSMLVLSVPLRRTLKGRGVTLGNGALATSAAGWGVLVGGTSGAGIILISLLMAAGLEGAAVIATDAAVSTVMGVLKFGVFGVSGVITAQVVAVGLLMGVIAVPGAWLAKRLTERLPLRVHTAILDAVVITGGAAMLFRAATF
ncbi:sulfite exporter TauE/SafE family protein [Rhodoplanes roseus]|uniref:Probable membrane transporter protein n=1 Tax=Rhodoplanes roseus TaxID=29409 RepID=A0A327KRR3_9BRAD|nr:sulfite exporter TauE/SafE family protein [Rhodoplanes roseus]RAI39982.1 hypothetical protein CH341_24745 [Rhodoplanes roseus]